MKRFIGIFLVFVLVIGAICSVPYAENAFDFLKIKANAASEGDITFALDYATNTYIVTGYNNTLTGDLVIPSTHNGLPVTKIKGRAFYGCTGITSLTISEGVTIVDYEAFRNCSALVSVTIPDSVTGKGYDAFSGLSSVKYLSVGKGLESIGMYIFKDSKAIEELYIDSSNVLSYFSYYSHFSKLKKVVLGNNITYVPSNSFNSADQLVSVTIGAAVERIEYNAFYNCKNLSEVTYNGTSSRWDSITVEFGNDYLLSNNIIFKISEENSLQNLSFVLNSDMNSYSVERCNKDVDCGIIIPSTYNGKTVTGINEGAFLHCSKMDSIYIPDTISKIDYYAFYNCSGLEKVYITDIAKWCNISFNYEASNPLLYADLVYEKKVVTDLVIPEGVTTISPYAFLSYKSLVSVTFPESLTKICEKAFANCSNLSSVMYPFSTEKWNAITIDVSNTSLINAIKYFECNQDNSADYLDFTFNSATQSYSVSYCSPYTFGDMFIPSTYNGFPVTEISSFAFQNCDNLKSVTIPNSIEEIHHRSFDSCTGLTSIVIPDSVKYIWSSAFGCCSNLYDIKIPASVIYIDSGAFSATAYANDINNWDDGLLYIDNHLVDANSNSISGDFVVKDGTLTISSGLFMNNNYITSVTIPDSVVGIGQNLFDSCKNLEKVYLGSGVKVIGCLTFYSCPKLKSVYIKDMASWLSINYRVSMVAGSANALYNGADLYLNGELVTDLYVPDSITAIPDYAFNYGNSFTSITIPDTVTSIGKSAFRNCANLEAVTIPRSVTQIDKNAFYNCNATIYCFENSYAHQYAIQNNVDYKIIYFTATEQATIDYENNVIFTTDYSCDDISEMLVEDSGINSVVTPSYKNGATEIYGTGSEVSLYNGSEILGNYKVVVNGDLTGDGVCNVLDAFEAERASNGHIEASTEQIYAANGCVSNEITLSTYQTVVNKALKS